MLELLLAKESHELAEDVFVGRVGVDLMLGAEGGVSSATGGVGAHRTAGN